jgi:Histidine kinase
VANRRKINANDTNTHTNDTRLLHDFLWMHYCCYMNTSGRRRWWMLTLWWVGYSIYYARQVTVWDALEGRAIGFSENLAWSVTCHLVWIPLSVALFWWSDRWAIEKSRIVVPLAMLLLGAVALAPVHTAYLLLADSQFHFIGMQGDFADMLLRGFRSYFIQACLVILAAHAFLYAERLVMRDRQISTLQARLAQARLDALSAQLNPHFLFNALNTIAEEVHRDAEAADRMIVSLSFLLRRSLDSAAVREISLREELDALSHYLNIQKARLGDRLRIVEAIAPDCLEATIPPMLLQPIVENAVTHGIARSLQGGEIHLLAQRHDDTLIVEIDNIGGSAESMTKGHGIGLRNTIDRLECLYGSSAASLQMTPHADGGARVVLKLPFRMHASPPPDMRRGGPAQIPPLERVVS